MKLVKRGEIAVSEVVCPVDERERKTTTRKRDEQKQSHSEESRTRERTGGNIINKYKKKNETRQC